jgi:hypothetical protein
MIMGKYKWLILTLLFVGLVTSAQAATIAVGSAIGSPGETLLVPVSIDDTAGMASCNIAIAFDKTSLEFLGKDDGDLGAGILGPRPADANKSGKYSPIVAFSGEKSSGTIMYLKLSIRGGAKGDIPLIVTVPTPGGIYQTVSGKITVR